MVWVDWKEEGHKYALMTLLGGIPGGAFYSGIYDWVGAVQDMERAEQRVRNYSLPYREVLGVWFD